MAREDQVTLLKQGPQAWNAWRHEQPNAIVDLSVGELRELNLAGADLSGADLRGADLRGNVLKGSNLAGARLDGANLFKAILDGADFASWVECRDDLDQRLAETGIPVIIIAETNLGGTTGTEEFWERADFAYEHLKTISAYNLSRADAIRDVSSLGPSTSTHLVTMN